jgi:hypothetical protein
MLPVSCLPLNNCSSVSRPQRREYASMLVCNEVAMVLLLEIQAAVHVCGIP